MLFLRLGFERPFDCIWYIMGKKRSSGVSSIVYGLIRDHINQPNINTCMVALSDHLRINMTESIVHNWFVQRAKKSLTRKTGRDLSFGKEKRFRLPIPFVFNSHIFTTYMSNQLGWDNCDSYIDRVGKFDISWIWTQGIWMLQPFWPRRKSFRHEPKNWKLGRRNLSCRGNCILHSMPKNSF